MCHQDVDLGRAAAGRAKHDVTLVGELAQRGSDVIVAELVFLCEIVDGRRTPIGRESAIDGNAELFALLRRGHRQIMPDGPSWAGPGLTMASAAARAQGCV